METIYNLQKRASELRNKMETNSITPEEVGSLHADTLAYLADMEQSVDGLGIRKMYKTVSAMEADTTPTGTNGKVLRYGQLVIIYDETDTTSATNGDLYTWQKPGWLKIGNIGNIYELETIRTELQKPISTDKIENGAVTSAKLADGVIQPSVWDNIAEFSGFTDQSAKMTAPIKKTFGGWFWSTADKSFLAYNTVDKKFYTSFSFFGMTGSNDIILSEKHLYVNTSQNKVYRWNKFSGLILVGEQNETITTANLEDQAVTTEKIADKAVTVDKLDLKDIKLFAKEENGATVDFLTNQDGELILSIPYLTTDGKLQPEEVEIPVATSTQSGIMSAEDKQRLENTMTFKGIANKDANKALNSGIYPTVTVNVPKEGESFLVQTFRTGTAVYNMYYSTQIAFGTSDNVKGKVYMRYNSQKAGEYNYGEWIDISGGGSDISGMTESDVENLVNSVFDGNTISSEAAKSIVNDAFDEVEDVEE